MGLGPESPHRPRAALGRGCGREGRPERCSAARALHEELLAVFVLAKEGVDSAEAAAGDTRAVDGHATPAPTQSSSVTPAAVPVGKHGHAAEGMRLPASIVMVGVDVESPSRRLPGAAPRARAEDPRQSGEVAVAPRLPRRPARLHRRLPQEPDDALRRANERIRLFRPLFARMYRSFVYHLAAPHSRASSWAPCPPHLRRRPCARRPGCCRSIARAPS
jgi:hypothetical protein